MPPKEVESSEARGIRARQSSRFFCAHYLRFGREGDGYNTRKGKKSTRRASGFQPLARLTALGESGSVRFSKPVMEHAMSQSLGASAPVVFQFQQSPITVILRDGEPWFIASEILTVLKLHRTATRRLEDDERGVHKTHTLGGDQEITVISEPGLYRLIGRSNKPEAKVFNRWVCHEVLPAIRKTGRYEAAPSVASERLQPAFALAAEAIAQVSRVVFDSVMSCHPNSEWWKHQRFLLCFTHEMKPYVKAIPDGTITVPLSRLAEMIAEPNGLLPSNAELTKLAAACCQRLAQQLPAIDPKTA
jgi:prophage antirepressor-like protein